MDTKLISALKLIADKRMEHTLDKVFNEDKDYRRMTEAVIAMEKQYDSIGLNPSIKDVIDNLLAGRDGINMEKISLAYWAGMIDAVTILRDMEIITF